MKSSRVYIDASIAVKWVVSEEWSKAAIALREEWRAQGKEFIAPPHLPIEVTNAIYQYVRRRELSAAQARSALKEFLNVRVTLVSSASLYQAAFNLALRLKLPALYDAHYLALARQSRCEFWTADEKLYLAVHRKLPWVKRIGRDESN